MIMKKFLKVMLIILIIILVVVLVAFFAVSNQSKATEIKFGEDKVETLFSVLGEERKVTGVKVGIDNGVNYKILNYEPSEISSEDLNRYVNHLLENGFIVTKNEGTKTEVEVAKKSVEEGKILQITIYRTENDVHIQYLKGEGTLTLF